MSDDKKRDRALQHRVRERQAKTGESYQAAWRSLAGHKVSESPNHFWASRGKRRVPLSLSTLDKIRPGESAQITARPQLDAFWPDRFLIKDTDRWKLHKLVVRSWLNVSGDDEHGALEDAGAEVSLIKADCDTSVFSLDTWHPLIARKVLCGQEIAVVVTYTGPSEQGEAFEASLFGSEGPPSKESTKRRVVNGSDCISERTESRNVGSDKTIELPLIVKASALLVDHLIIAEAEDWIVHDIRVHGKSIFLQAGDLPGEMFSDFAPVILEPLAAGDRVEIAATYIGINPSTRLVVELSGGASATSIPHALSYFLPISTSSPSRPILPAQSAQITARTQRSFLPERLVVTDPDDWTIESITIGTHHQFAAGGGIPGQSFAHRTVGGYLSLDPVHAGQDFVVVTSRKEDCKEGACFLCGAQGRLVQAT